jgi:tetrahydromethanopterin S-methyltransferase subunit G
MTKEINQKIINICNEKIEKKGDNVGLSFYAFFANKNDNPKLLMQVAEWWILKHKLDHFEKAVKIKKMIERDS